ncbi:hypothetical protein [Anaeromicropila herbilytica]|uniref:DUF4352 domain-containing protein n=1 Tax=Anaeromicropila herbilytica TaxID=2785025 RepID=A0A7R7ICC0_9FIRM|nr:hypothetical protein [Anaeromicropila herbilytica]BCN30442.1 hypothetical protein bsdtb5_17370 [Anaeromicropila herbilytica]
MKKKFIFVMIIATISLTGCAKTQDMSEEKTKMVTEYMAGLLLKYDKNYEEKLVYKSKEESTTNNLATQETYVSYKNNEVVQNSEVSNGSVDSSNVGDYSNTDENQQVLTSDDSNKDANYMDLNKIINIKDFQLSYVGSSLLSKYPKEASDASIMITPGEGNKLLIVEFNIKNTSTEEKSINLKNYKISYIINNNDNKIKSQLTLLNNDLHYFNSKIKGNESKKAVLFFEVPENYNISEADLYIDYQDKTAKVNLK